MKFIKFALLVTVAVFISVQSASAKIMDETGTNDVIAADDIPNRPMKTDANLKAIQIAFDKSDPRANVKRFPYDPDVTYKIRLREFMGSTIVLPKGETIAGYSLFDEHNFTFTPMSDKNPVLVNVFVVYAKYHGADTNLIVHGESGNIYSFYLRNDSVDSDFMPSLVTYIEDPATSERIKRQDEVVENEKAAALAVELAEKNKKEKPDTDYLKEIPTKVEGSTLNFGYEFRGGDDKIKPIRVFDDGYFTWFQFGEKDLNKVANLPTIYRVIEGYDTPVNSRIVGGSIVAETISDKWTIRSGETHYCIWSQD
jgi:type IV secretory pathway VirB9-like protein